MKNSFTVAFAGVVALGAGCSATDGNASRTIQVGANSLGITQLDVTDTADRSTITGVNSAGETVAEAEMIRGQFMWSWEDDAGTKNQEQVDGRQIKITARGQTARWSNPGYEPFLHMPRMPQVGANQFAAEPHVKAELASWGIGFDGGDIEQSATATESKFSLWNNTSIGGQQGIRTDPCSGTCNIQSGSTAIGSGCDNSDGIVGARNFVSGTDVNQNPTTGEDAVLFACNYGQNVGGFIGFKTCHYDGARGGTSSCGSHGSNALCSNPCMGYGSGNGGDYSGEAQGIVQTQFGGGNDLYAWVGALAGSTCSTAPYGCLYDCNTDGDFCTN